MSDHNTILLSSRQFSTKLNDHRVEVKVRSNDTNGRNLLAYHLSGYNWHDMESLGPVDQKVEYFNNYIQTQLDHYLLTYSVIRHTYSTLIQHIRIGIVIDPIERDNISPNTRPLAAPIGNYEDQCFLILN